MLDKLANDLKAALKGGDKLRVSVLRMLISELKNARIAKGADLDEGETAVVVQRAVKKREEASQAFRDGGRAEAAERERTEGEMLRAYLPRALTAEELDKIADEIIAEVGAAGKRDIGNVMKTLMSRYRGRVDGRAAQELVSSKLEYKGLL